MALTNTQVTVAGKEYDVIELDETLVLPKHRLLDNDLKIVEKIDAEGVGANLKAKMDAFVMPNGKTASTTYEAMITTADDFEASAYNTVALSFPRKKTIELMIAGEAAGYFDPVTTIPTITIDTDLLEEVSVVAGADQDLEIKVMTDIPVTPVFNWKVDKGEGFVDIAVATGPKIVLTAVTSEMDGWKYKCEVSYAGAAEDFVPTVSEVAVLAVA